MIKMRFSLLVLDTTEYLVVRIDVICYIFIN